MDLRPLVDILNHLADIYKKNSKKSDRDYDECRKYAEISHDIVIGIPTGFALMVAVYQGIAIVNGWMLGDLKASANIYFPFLDQCGSFGLILTILFNIVCTYVCGLTLLPYEITTYLVFANITLISTVIERDLGDLKAALENPRTTRYEIKQKLLAIIRSYCEYNE